MSRRGYVSCKRHCGARPCKGATVSKVTRHSLRETQAPDPNDVDAGPSSSGEANAIIALTVEPSCKDEASIGQKNGVVRQWARRGTRPRQPADQRYKSAYLFGAICPARGTGAALALPFADTEAMQLHLDEISRHVARRAHAVLLLDRAGWHTTAKLKVPKNITLIFLPPRAPELNPVEKVGSICARTGLSNRVFEGYDAIIDAACGAWRELIERPKTITSIGMREWAHVGQSN